MFEDISECFKVGITPANEAMPQFEGRDVGLAHNLVISIHLSSESMCLWISDFDF